MKTKEFLSRHALAPEAIDGETCLSRLMDEIALGLKGEGCIPMLPSYLSTGLRPTPGAECCVLDAGGTNLRAAAAVFDAEGECHLSHLTAIPMPGTEGELTAAEFFRRLADTTAEIPNRERIGFCFSYNVLLDRTLDGVLEAWCKEVRVPEALGMPVGASLRDAVGGSCRRVNVLNDSVAALLWAASRSPDIRLGLILGTGVNICYEEPCVSIPKVPDDLRAPSMVISTEIGEFQGIPKSTFDRNLIAASDDPALAHAEKQCAGGYLGDLISLAWQKAAEEGVISAQFSDRTFSLPEISLHLAGGDTTIPSDENAAAIARVMVARAAKIAAILTAGAVLRCTKPGEDIAIAVEGSQFAKLTGFGEAFLTELAALLTPRNITARTVQFESSCLKGAALAAFAEPM